MQNLVTHIEDQDQRVALQSLAQAVGCVNSRPTQDPPEGSISAMLRMLATAMQKHPNDTAATMRLIKNIAEGD